MSERRASYLYHTVSFTVTGTPRPKQSFRYSSRGGYQPKRVTDWQDEVRAGARQAMGGDPCLTGAVAVRLAFYLPDNRRVDCDNLAKAVIDSLRGVVYGDDAQVMDLRITKHPRAAVVGVEVNVYPGDRLPEGA